MKSKKYERQLSAKKEWDKFDEAMKPGSDFRKWINAHLEKRLPIERDVSLNLGDQSVPTLSVRVTGSKKLARKFGLI